MSAPCCEISSGSHQTRAKKRLTVITATEQKNNPNSRAIFSSASLAQSHECEKRRQVQCRSGTGKVSRACHPKRRGHDACQFQICAKLPAQGESGRGGFFGPAGSQIRHAQFSQQCSTIAGITSRELGL